MLSGVDKILNKYLLAISIIILIFVVGIKIHSELTFSHIEDWNYNQIEKIDKNITNFSFAVFGDNKNSITTFNNLIARVNSENISFSIDDGDLVFDGSEEKYMFFIKQIKNFHNPIITVVGNHDITDDGRANYYKFFGRFYYSFHTRDAYFIILDDANEKNIDPWQMQWLNEELEKSYGYRYRFVFMHVPLFDPREGSKLQYMGLGDKEFAIKLNKIFDEYNITMVFASHIHGYWNGTWGKTSYIITGGAGAELLGIDPEHYFYHYIIVNVTNKGVTYEVKKLNAPQYDPVSRALHDLWIYVYAFVAINYLGIVIFIISLYLIWYAISYIRNKLNKR